MKKCICFIAMIFLCLQLTACEKKERVIDANADGVIKVCIIGNSLIYSGNTHGYFEEMCKNAGKNLVMDTNLISSAALIQTIPSMLDLYSNTYFLDEKFDFVVMTDHGSYQYSLTKGLKTLLDVPRWDNTRIFYLMSQFDFNGRQKELKKLKEVEVCYGYALHKKILDSGEYVHDEIHIANDYHPDILGGFLNASMLYATLFDENPADTVITPHPKAHGNTDEEKLAETKRLATMAYELAKEYKEKEKK